MTRLLKFAFAGLVFWLALFVGHQNAHASTWRTLSVDPSTIASDANSRQFQVTISLDTGYAGSAFVGGATDSLWLSRSAYLDAKRGGGAGMFILLHEIGHTTGIANERQANCYALKHLRGTLQRYFGLNTRQLRLRYQAALGQQRTQPAEYRFGACL